MKKILDKKMAEELEMTGCPQCGSVLDDANDVYFCPTCKWTTRVEPEKVGVMKRIWVWLDGKKTLIGTTGGLVGLGLTKIPHAITQAVGYFLQAICWPLTAIGVVHKVGKKSSYSHNGEFNLEDLVTAVKDLFSAISRIFKILSKFKHGGKHNAG